MFTLVFSNGHCELPLATHTAQNSPHITVKYSALNSLGRHSFFTPLPRNLAIQVLSIVPPHCSMVAPRILELSIRLKTQYTLCHCLLYKHMFFFSFFLCLPISVFMFMLVGLGVLKKFVINSQVLDK